VDAAQCDAEMGHKVCGFVSQSPFHLKSLPYSSKDVLKFGVSQSHPHITCLAFTLSLYHKQETAGISTLIQFTL